MGITANTLTRWDLHILDYFNVTRTNIVANGLTIVNSCRVLPLDYVDIDVHAFVFLEVAVLACVFFYATLLEIVN